MRAVALLLSIVAVPAAARTPGEVFHTCRSEAGPDPAAGPRGAYLGGTAEVEADGKVTALHLYRIEAARMRWSPRDAATPRHVHLGARFTGPPPFGAEQLLVEVELVSRQRLRRPLGFALAGRGLQGLSPWLASIPAWRHSASVWLPWPTLRAIAADGGTATVTVTSATRPERIVHSASLDVASLGRDIAGLAKVTADLQAMAGDAASRCTRSVEPEVDETATL